ncbi:MAG: TIM barrel protein, partial [Flavobacteriaceae bacterium]
MKRRSFIQNVPAALMVAPLGIQGLEQQKKQSNSNIAIHHSVARWCLSSYDLDHLLPRLKDLGIHSIDLVGPQDFKTLKKYDMHCSMCEGAAISLTEGFNDPQYHDELVKRYTEVIPQVADAGYTNLICFSGNRRGMNDLVGLENCAKGLERLLPLAETHNVTLQMELFNAQDHPDYMADSSLWGISLCRRLGSDHFKLLYDIYHMQIQEGDISTRSIPITSILGITTPL